MVLQYFLIAFYEKASLTAAICLMLYGVTEAQTIYVKSIPSKTISIDKNSNIKKELFKFLLDTHQADGPESLPAMYQIDILNLKSQYVTVYKFGITSAHAKYNIVFRYSDKLVFSSANDSGIILKLFGDFVTRYPKTLSLDQQKKAIISLIDIVDHNQWIDKQDF